MAALRKCAIALVVAVALLALCGPAEAYSRTLFAAKPKKPNCKLLPGCKSCTDLTACTTCNKGYTLSNGTCGCAANFGSYFDAASFNGTTVKAPGSWAKKTAPPMCNYPAAKTSDNKMCTCEKCPTVVVGGKKGTKTQTTSMGGPIASTPCGK